MLSPPNKKFTRRHWQQEIEIWERKTKMPKRVDGNWFLLQTFWQCEYISSIVISLLKITQKQRELTLSESKLHRVGAREPKIREYYGASHGRHIRDKLCNTRTLQVHHTRLDPASHQCLLVIYSFQTYKNCKIIISAKSLTMHIQTSVFKYANISFHTFCKRGEYEFNNLILVVHLNYPVHF